MPHRSSILIFILPALIAASCGIQVQPLTTATATPWRVTSTFFPAFLTQIATETPLPPPTQPTTAPVEGTTSTQLNVRAEPSTAGKILGLLPGNTKVQITGKDPGENWWQINYAQGVDGKGWITAQYVRTASKPQVPTIGGTQASPQSGNTAVVQQQINIRSGPGTSFNSLGTLNARDVVTLVGKDSDGAWLQIDFAAGPQGKGWVNAAFVRAQGVENLPVVAETGRVVGTGTPTASPRTPTPTVVPARADNDSPQAPIVSVIFEPLGTRALIYNGDISSPQGDSEDWIAFKPDRPFVLVSLECFGSDSLRVDMLENSLLVNTYINCGGQANKISVKPGSNYLIHIQAAPSGDLQYTSYTLTIKTEP